ncbi:putative WW domain-containing protein [Septoria linicola]|nr:putative WW domain-containing protein [Septoria linicola]
MSWLERGEDSTQQQESSRHEPLGQLHERLCSRDSTRQMPQTLKGSDKPPIDPTMVAKLGNTEPIRALESQQLPIPRSYEQYPSLHLVQSQPLQPNHPQSRTQFEYSHNPIPRPPPLQLPVGWSAYFDPSQGKYYYHERSTGLVQWSLPVAPTENLAHAEYGGSTLSGSSNHTVVGPSLPHDEGLVNEWQDEQAFSREMDDVLDYVFDGIGGSDVSSARPTAKATSYSPGVVMASRTPYTAVSLIKRNREDGSELLMQ